LPEQRSFMLQCFLAAFDIGNVFSRPETAEQYSLLVKFEFIQQQLRAL